MRNDNNKYGLVVCLVLLLALPEYTNAKEKEEFHQSIEGQSLTSPVVVFAKDGIALIRGNTFVNNSPIVEKDRQEPASMLDIRPQQQGRRIIITDNRFINRAPIVHSAGGTASMSTITRQTTRKNLRITSQNNSYANKGRMTSRN